MNRINENMDEMIVSYLSQELEQILSYDDSFSDTTIHICIYRINENCYYPFIEFLFQTEKSKDRDGRHFFPTCEIDPDENEKERKHRVYTTIDSVYKVNITNIFLQGFHKNENGHIIAMCKYNSYEPISNRGTVAYGGTWKIMFEIIQRKFLIDSSIYEHMMQFFSPLLLKPTNSYSSSLQLKHPKIMYLCIQNGETDKTLLVSKQKNYPEPTSFYSLYIPTFTKEITGDYYYFTLDPIFNEKGPYEKEEYETFVVFEDMPPFQKVEITKEVQDISFVKKIESHGNICTLSFIENGINFYKIKFPNQFTRASI